MVEITSMMVRSFDLDHLDLFWEIAPLPAGTRDESVPHEIYDYDFYILRAYDSPSGPFAEIAGPFRDTYMFRDTSVSLLAKWRPYFYKIRVVHRPTGQEVEYGPVTSDAPPPDKIAAEIIRQEQILFREFVGRKCYLFPIRTSGPMCTCVDPVLRRQTRSNHLPCFSTGWLGGYMSPIEIFVQIDPNAKVEQVTPVSVHQSADVGARTISFPPIKPGDILVEVENRRWRVSNVTPTQRLRAVIRQELSLHEIPKGDTEFELPINVDVRSLNPAAERNFTNPQSLRDDDFSDIFTFFGNSRGTVR